MLWGKWVCQAMVFTARHLAESWSNRQAARRLLAPGVRLHPDPKDSSLAGSPPQTQRALMPPSTTSDAPVTYLASSLARYNAA